MEVVQRVNGHTTDGRTDDDGRQVITIAHPEPCSGELISVLPEIITLKGLDNFHHFFKRLINFVASCLRSCIPSTY